ncbi:MAG: hypothetical protein JWQ43_3343, partial [Glaciihabitans sp.]|nr:hypothetical protein [Glaciihabitans sp.]
KRTFVRSVDAPPSPTPGIWGGAIAVLYISALLIVSAMGPALACNESDPARCTVIGIAWAGFAMTVLLLSVVVAALFAAPRFVHTRYLDFVCGPLFVCLALVVVVGVNIALRQTTQTQS